MDWRLEQVELAKAGVTVSLSKPFSPRDLLSKVNELLEKREAATTAPRCLSQSQFEGRAA